MLKWLKSLFSMPEPSGPSRTIRAFSPGERTISQDGVGLEEDGLRIDSAQSRTVRLFEVKDPGVQQCMLTFRAEMKAENMEGRAYLEMWCVLPGKGEFFSKGLQQTLSGTADWARYEIPFYLRKGQAPELIRLNLAIEGRGVVWLRHVELLETPLAN